jgi:hypothetical protein
MSTSDVATYLAQYFVTATADFLIKHYDCRNITHFDIAVGELEVAWMQSRSIITLQEANTLRMIIRTRKIDKLLQQLNEIY